MWICILLKKKSVYSNHLFFIKSYEVCCKFDHWSGGCRGESCIDVIFFFFFFSPFFITGVAKSWNMTLVGIYSCQVTWEKLCRTHMHCCFTLIASDFWQVMIPDEQVLVRSINMFVLLWWMPHPDWGSWSLSSFTAS